MSSSEQPCYPLGRLCLVRLVKPAEGEEKTPGGIILPETRKKEADEHRVGVLVDIGADAELPGSDSLVGEQPDIESHVILGKHSGVNVKFGDDEYVLIEDKLLLAVLP